MEKSEYVDAVRKNYPVGSISQMLAKFQKLKVLVIGEAIIDEYHFTTPKGRAAKDPILSVDYVKHEAYAGGILAIANHVSNFVESVTCVTALGDKNDKRDFVAGILNENVSPRFYVKENSPSTTKKRYLDIVRNEKLFKVEFINDAPISKMLEAEIIDFLRRELPKHDLVLVGDFGHGLMTDKIINIIEENSRYLAVNVQCNSANLGFNYVTKYKKASFVSMDIPELQYAVGDKFSEVPVLMDKLHLKTNFRKFLVTMSKEGSGYFNSGKKTFFPSFVMRPIDTVGAGDAVFSVTSLFAYCGIDDVIPFIANCVGGIAVSYMGNKEFITKNRLLGFIEEVYNGDKKTLHIESNSFLN